MTPVDLNLLGALGIDAAVLAARPLSPHLEASELVVAEVGEEGRQFMLTPATSAAWSHMKSQAQRDGINLLMVSAFRSVQRQTEIIQQKLDAGLCIADILSVCAPPGFSEHHTGRAIDITCREAPDLAISFEDTVAFAWLQQHAPTYGFRLSYPRDNAAGFEYEPWHWCYQDAATVCGDR
jgi:D-alanyl-D-alanine carboxypeptidase